ncbi:MAG TPA: hypothetical protein VM782_20865 [Stellaceae bacterium]|nr:hypothetical protein [Stellaceae bacterium]
MKSSRHEILHRHGYVAVTEMRDMLDRLCRRMAELDEPMAREYVLNAPSSLIEHEIRRMCKRRRAILHRLAEAELGRIADGAVTPPAASDHRR